MPLTERKDFSADSFIGIWELSETEEELLQIYPASEEELFLLHSFTHAYRKKQFLATRLLLHTLVPNAKIVYDGNGKPHLQENSGTENSRHISISHSASYIAIFVNPHVCGIDLELVRPKIERIAPKFLCEEELSIAMEEPAMERLHVYWCVKEALYKVYGKKNVSLRTNIFVHQIENTVSGKVLATLSHEGNTLKRMIAYERFRDCMLAWTENTGE